MVVCGNSLVLIHVPHFPWNRSIQPGITEILQKQLAKHFSGPRSPLGNPLQDSHGLVQPVQRGVGKADDSPDEATKLWIIGIGVSSGHIFLLDNAPNRLQDVLNVIQSLGITVI